MKKRAPKLFQLWVTVIRWVDGDTFYGVLDHGVRIYTGRTDKPVRFRCAIINAPELATDPGKAALAYAEQLVPAGDYPCYSTGLDEYGRPLLDLMLPGGRFSDLMMAAGQADRYGRARGSNVESSSTPESRS